MLARSTQLTLTTPTRDTVATLCDVATASDDVVRVYTLLTTLSRLLDTYLSPELLVRRPVSRRFYEHLKSAPLTLLEMMRAFTLLFNNYLKYNNPSEQVKQTKIVFLKTT